jgi:hypothetical protein
MPLTGAWHAGGMLPSGMGDALLPAGGVSASAALDALLAQMQGAPVDTEGSLGLGAEELGAAGGSSDALPTMLQRWLES